MRFLLFPFKGTVDVILSDIHIYFSELKDKE